jgi:uncharacterized protein YkwD
MRRSKWIAGPALGLIAVLVLVLGGGTPSATASGGGCSRLGDTGPRHLSPAQARRAVMCLINERRENYGVHPLDRNKHMQRAAQRHSNKMEDSGCFSHQCYGEGSLDTRLRSTGYLSGSMSSWGYSENIAWGRKRHATPRAIVGAWMASPPHRANILNGSFDDMGVGFAQGTPYKEGANGGIYTADFGRRG